MGDNAGSLRLGVGNSVASIDMMSGRTEDVESPNKVRVSVEED